MRCEYCDVEVTQYRENGICACCGGRLLPRPAAKSAGPVCVPSPMPIHTPMMPPVRFVPGVNCCPKCHNTRIVWKKRGFTWGLGMLGFFLVPVLGIFLGFIGSGNQRLHCTNCSHTWKRR